MLVLELAFLNVEGLVEMLEVKQWLGLAHSTEAQTSHFYHRLQKGMVLLALAASALQLQGELGQMDPAAWNHTHIWVLMIKTKGFQMQSHQLQNHRTKSTHPAPGTGIRTGGGMSEEKEGATCSPCPPKESNISSSGLPPPGPSLLDWKSIDCGSDLSYLSLPLSRLSRSLRLPRSSFNRLSIPGLRLCVFSFCRY